MLTTKVGKVTVPLRYQQRCAVWRFDGGHLKDDAGVYAFWTAVLRRVTDGRSKLTARNKVGLEAGERFTRMDAESRARKIPKAHRPIYAALWKRTLGRGKNVRYVRPATSDEVENWMATHETDADHGTDLREHE